MKTKILALFSVINILVFLGFYTGWVKPMMNENQKLGTLTARLSETLLESNTALMTLKQSLNNFRPSKSPSTNQFTKIIIKLAKKQHVSIKQVEPLTSDSLGKKGGGLSIQTSGSYENSVKFIFYVNQLPFLLHWSTISLLRVNKELELTGSITKNE